jgi:3-phenylpropionate/cinnamic acid dioxygenase small subunit
VEPEKLSVEDRLEIDDLLTRYATAIDGLDFDLLDTVFTADAHLDYRSAGGIEGSYPEVRNWLSKVLPIFDVTQHLVVNRVFATVGDAVHVTSAFLNTNRLKVDEKPWTFTVGGRYRDVVDKTVDGWRIGGRVEDTLWWDNPMPGLPDVPFAVTD